MRKYFKYKIKSLLVVRRIISIHYLEPDCALKQEEERHDFWEIIFSKRGNVVCTCDDKVINLTEGNILFHKPNEAHTLSCDKGSGVFVISFDCLSEAMRFFSDRNLSLNQRQINIVNDVIEIAKKTYDIAFENSDVEIMNLLPQPMLGGEQLIKNNLEMLLIDIMRTLTETEDGNDVFLPEKELNNKLAKDIITILKENLFNRLTIDDIARKISYSKAYIFRQFKIATDKSVMEYYIDLKIKWAKKMLVMGDLSVKEISEKLAFDTPNYFTKTFKKITNYTPTEYKRQQKK